MNINKQYIASVHKDKYSDYGVQFYDFVGCISLGETIESAKIMAKEALQGHIEVMLEDGDDIPLPFPFEQIINNDDHKDAVAFLVINVSIDIVENNFVFN